MLNHCSQAGEGWWGRWQLANGNLASLGVDVIYFRHKVGQKNWPKFGLKFHPTSNFH